MNVQSLAEQFKTEVEKTPCDFAKCDSLLAELKKQFMPIFAAAAAPQTPSEQQTFCLARETLEYAVLLSTKKRDLTAFERNFALLKSMYYDYQGLVEDSSRYFLLVGMNLLQLLVQNRIADFHIELERIPIQHHDNEYIKQAIQLELYLMEGSYTKLRNARAGVASEMHTTLLDMLMSTVREEIADCSESAFTSLTLKEAADLLMLDSEDAIVSYCAERSWKVSPSGVITFENDHREDGTVKGNEVIIETLSYAKELERII